MTRRQALLLPISASVMWANTKNPDPTGFMRINLPRRGEQHPVFHSARNGPPIIILHELPGMTPDDLALGRRVGDECFTTYLPLIFGAANEYKAYFNAFRACHSGQINCSSTNGKSHCIGWLKQLCDEVSQIHDGAPVGVVGMCITGAFPIAMLSQPCVKAAVLSQPSLPIGRSNAEKAALGISQVDINAAKRSGKPLLGLRFQTDTICPPERFATLRNTFATFREIQIPPRPGDPERDSHAMHAVLTGSYSSNNPALKAAYDEVIKLFRQQLV